MESICSEPPVGDDNFYFSFAMGFEISFTGVNVQYCFETSVAIWDGTKKFHKSLASSAGGVLLGFR